MSRQAIQRVLDQVPELNDSGIGLCNDGRRLTLDPRKAKLEKERQELLENTEEFEKACEWLFS